MIPVRSSQEIRGSWVEVQNRRAAPLIDFEMGGPSLNSPSDNLQSHLWTAESDGTTVKVFRDNVAPVIILTDVGITQIALAFDQSMRPHIAYMAGGVCKFYWFDTLANAPATMTIPGATTPRLCMDEKRQYYTNDSDVILSYKSGKDLVVRVQRERFQTARIIDTGIPGDLLVVGINSRNRLQWFCLGERDP